MASQFHNLAVSSLTCCSTALRASSSGLDGNHQLRDGPRSIPRLARAKTLNLARPITRPRFLRRPRTWFSRSRLILTSSSARLASSALTEVVLSISLTCTLLEPTRLHDARDPDGIVAVAFVDLPLEHRLGMSRVDTDHRQTKSRLSSVHSHVDVGPVSKPIRTAFGAFDVRRKPISPRDRNRPRPLVRPSQPGPPRRLMSASTTRPVRHSIALSLSIVARPHGAGLICSWRADSLAFVWLDPGITPCCKSRKLREPKFLVKL